MALERDIQAKYIKSLEREGWFVVKLIKTTKAGIPDLLAIKDGIFTFIEVKRPGGKLSKLQEYRIKELEKFGARVEVFFGS